MTRKTPLYDTHIQSNAKMVTFGEYEMPVWFSGLKEEHFAVRQSVGVFDISHMGVFQFSGPNAFSFIQRVICNDLSRVKGDKMIYAMVLNHDGGILDDIMVGPLGDTFVMVVNASNKEKLKAWFETVGMKDVVLDDLSATQGLIAVQGPHALATLEKMGESVSDHPRFATWKTNFLGVSCVMMRNGYTGEDGVEILLPHDQMATIWKSLVEQGVTPCGLGARDSLRIEAGLPLYGQELSEDLHPLMTRYASWVVKFDKADFIGKEALLRIQDQKKEWTTVGLSMVDRGIARSHYPILEGGEVTSGTYSPTLEKAIAIARVNPKYSEIGTRVTVEIRGKGCQAEVVKLPFLKGGQG